MRNERSQRLLAVALLAAVIILLDPPAATAADAYPTKVIRLVINNPPGGFADIIGRIVANPLSVRLGKQMVVDNRGGGAGVQGTETVAKASADGYTLLICTGAHAVQPAVQKLPYEITKDFSPIGLAASGHFGLVVHPNVTATSTKELISNAKQKPGQLIFAVAGFGQLGHMGLELFKLKAGIDVMMINFRGGGPATIDLLGGHSHAMIGALAQLLPHIRSAKLRALGTTGEKRSASLPDVPTIMEAGVADYHFTQWLGLLAPAGTPSSIIDRLNKELKVISASEELQQQLINTGTEVDYRDPHDFRAFMKAELDKWAGVARAANVKVE